MGNCDSDGVIHMSWSRTSCPSYTLLSRSPSMSLLCILISGKTTQHPLMAKAMDLAQNSVMLSSQQSYRSLWNKWETFLHKYFPPVWTDIEYKFVQYNTLLDRLLMFVTYLAHEIKCNVRSIPSKMSALRHGMVTRLVKCCNAFDNDLLRSVKQGIALLPAPSKGLHSSI